MASFYQRVDKALGGYLPGGITPQQVQQEKQVSQPVTQQISQPKSTNIFQPPVTPLTPYLPTSKPSAPSGQGYSYVEPSTGKGYEVSPQGEVKEVVPVQGKPISEVQPIIKPTGIINNLNYQISQQRDIMSTQKGRGEINPLTYNIKGFGLGIASVGVGTLNLFRHPIKSAESTFSSLYNYRQTGEIIGSTLSNEPGYATGIIAGTYLTGKVTSKVVTTGVDVYRTRGLKEVPSFKVIAPEYPKQNYPKISKGQTAGELVMEFKKSGGGFTASPKPLSPSKGVLPGSSELPGLYQAPKISPTFLRIAGEEKKLFTLKPFGTLRPTASFITPESYKFAPGVRSGSLVNSKNLPKIKDFLNTKAEKGRAYVPFIKTEKEAIIPMETELKQLPTKNYFKFEGRRVPIEEFKTTLGGRVKGAKTVKDVYSTSYKSIGSKGYLSPSNLGSLGIYRSSNLKKSSYISPISSRKISPIASYNPIPSYRNIPKASSSFKGSYSTNFYNLPSLSYIEPSGGALITGIPFISSGINSLDFSEQGKKKVKGKKKKTRIAPSFTAQVFDIRGSLPKRGSFGISPFQLRKIPKGRGNPYETKF